MIRHSFLYSIILVLVISGGVAVGQKQPVKSTPASSIQKMDASVQKEPKGPSSNQEEARKWMNIKAAVQRLESALRKASRILQQSTLDIETASKGGAPRKTLDGKAISRRLDNYIQRLRQCVALKKGCEVVVDDVSDYLSSKVQFDIQQMNNEYSRANKALIDALREASNTSDSIISNIK
jgi:hypothetical protein